METTKKIRLRQTVVSHLAGEAVARVLAGGYLAEGEEVRFFEEEFSKHFNKKNCVAVNSGTSALELAYELVGIKAGDEVIVPVLTFVGANLPLVRRRAKVVFADIAENNFNLSASDVEKKITPATKAIIFVHFAGNNAGLDEILALGEKYKIKVIEDAAQAVGSDNWGKADFTAVSFQAIKILTTGDGGMLVCKNPDDCQYAKRLRWFGMDRIERQKTGYSDILEPGYKFHMNNIAGAIGRENLKIIDQVINHHKQLVEKYNSFTFPADWKIRIQASIWSCLVMADDREGLRQHLTAKGVDNGIYEFRNDIYSVFGKKRWPLPNMDKIENQYFYAPLHYGVSLADAEYIYSVVCDYYKHRN